ncbi:MAG: glutathione S-transferase family protein [Alkalinema sp. RU_4_3]|nr:glutathione S-transferase family protein [Alkalinema sp. RU_4_3]
MSLPAKAVIVLGRSIWTTIWQVMMAQLAPPSADGEYLRPESGFRGAIESEGQYRLFVGRSCPWAHRTLLVRALLGLEDLLPVSWTLPSAEDGGWRLAEEYQGCDRLSEVYQLGSPGYRGRSTVPMLWDEKLGRPVNNESSEIIVMLNEVFSSQLDLYPVALRGEIDRWNALIYDRVNNGVYRCGFAQSQGAYDAAVEGLFGMLEELEEHLEGRSFLVGEAVSLADVRLFPTLVRFDLVYFGLFKCCRRRVRDYRNLSRYVGEIYRLPGVADTCDFGAIVEGYYGSLFPLNPGGLCRWWEIWDGCKVWDTHFCSSPLRWD